MSTLTIATAPIVVGPTSLLNILGSMAWFPPEAVMFDQSSVRARLF
jgi:hypothetical protein